MTFAFVSLAYPWPVNLIKASPLQTRMALTAQKGQYDTVPLDV